MTTTITGYALRFNERSVDLGKFVEVLLPSMAARTVREVRDKTADLVLFNGHDSSRLLARVSAGTLAIYLEPRGLRFTANLPATSDGRDVGELVRRGDLRGASFAFRTITDRWHDEGGQLVRYVEDARIHEISVVALPAYPTTSVQLASRSTSVPPALQAAHEAIGRGPCDDLPKLRTLADKIRIALASYAPGTAIRCRWNADGESRMEVIPPTGHTGRARPHTTMPSASSASLAMLAAFQKQIEVELSL